MRTPISPIGELAVMATIAATLVPKQLDSPAADTSQSVAPLRIQIENASAAVVARVMIASPVPDTTMRVMSD
ncbi:hypothetical protein D6T64_01620 [Cryobacterium melibiosiphilum]|uniref:Uncharacterized protein n=1 Tax=Cryobacterium melibiosiphilum TaxID=995039 RepID=A0A3A5MN35_9MICO|nr:hypothetical protein D6T64_01620 [Cryobacterium melibiosiphilum]